MAWGEPRKRPHTGFLVRWFQWLNATWPTRYGKHSLHNGGRDANSLMTIVPCLFSHLPKVVDLVIVEAGSMLYSQNVSSIQTLTRQLLESQAAPTILFLNIHLWCSFGGSILKKTASSGTTELPDRAYAFFTNVSFGELRDADAQRRSALNLNSAAVPTRYTRTKSDWLEVRLTPGCLHACYMYTLCKLPVLIVCQDCTRLVRAGPGQRALRPIRRVVHLTARCAHGGLPRRLARIQSH